MSETIKSDSPMSVSADRPAPELTAVEVLYTKLDEASKEFYMLRQSPYFSNAELDELVSLAGHAKDSANWLRAQRDKAESPAADRPVENSELRELRWFPLQDGPRIPWSVAEKAYEDYARRFGRSQSLERLAERAGFGVEEMNDHHPKWRDEVEEIPKLRAEISRLRADRLSKQDVHEILMRNPLTPTLQNKLSRISEEGNPK